jgi:recombination protein RecA
VADAMKEMLRSGLFSIVVLDSIGAMIPEIEKEKDADEATVGTQAKIVTRMVKIAAVEAAKTSTVVLMINQVRANIGYGADTQTGGGWALKHSTTMKMKFRRTGTQPYKVKVDGEEEEVGHELAVKLERNRVAPKRQAIFSLFNQPTVKYGPIGVDRADEAATLGVRCKLIDVAGAWYTVKSTGERFQGREKLLEGLRAQPDIVDALRVEALATIAGDIIEGEQPGEDAEQPEAKSGSKFRGA